MNNKHEIPDSHLLEHLNENVSLRLSGRLLETGESQYQRYEVWETDALGRLFRLDGRAMTSEGDEFLYHESLVHPAAVMIDQPRRALVLGGGDGGSARQLLRHPSIEHVDIVELDAKVVDLSRRYLNTVHQGALDDPRVCLHIDDAEHYIRSTALPARLSYDLIVFDLTGSDGLAASLYQPAFLRACQQLLTQTAGLLTLHLGSLSHRPQQIGMGRNL